MNHHSSSGQNVLRVGNWRRYLVSRHPTRCLFIHQLLRKGANVRLLGLVIQRAAGAVPDKAHANAVEAWAWCHGISKGFKWRHWLQCDALRVLSIVLVIQFIYYTVLTTRNPWPEWGIPFQLKSKVLARQGGFTADNLIWTLSSATCLLDLYDMI